jgi:selenocysteine-specific elongation factor
VERHVVIGTAGHIDHGKTTLVKALTGVDTDRLAEEKARGITIDLGFAPLVLETGGHGGRPYEPIVHASIVDVPGHEGFIRNMVAGATGVDLALLVVAADDGVMAQTREHFAILGHLGVTRGVVALTKSDLAPDPAWQAMVADDIRALTAAAGGEPWPVVAVSATTGEGLDALRATLAAAALTVRTRAADDVFRMPVDRVFALAGAGTIVTGTVWSGGVAEGDEVVILPLGRNARVRSIQVHGAASARTGSGRRAALALVGVAREEIVRGMVIVSGAEWRATRAIDAAVRLAPDVVLKPRSRVRVHHGTAEVMGRVSRIGDRIPGTGDRSTAFAVRLRLDEPLVARAGDRFVLRSLSPVATIGGGTITDPWAERGPGQRRKQGPPMIPEETSGAAVARLITSRGNSGMTHAEIAVAAGLDVARLTAAIGEARQLGMVAHENWLVAGAEVTAAAARMKAALDAFHAAQPLEPGMSISAWRAAALGSHPGLAELAIAALESKNAVKRDGALVRRTTFNPSASAEAAVTLERVFGILREAGGEPPSAGEVAAALPGVDVPAMLRMLARGGRIVPVSDRYYARESLDAERERLIAILRELGPSSPAAIKERLGRSRKWLIPLLEWADREGVTVRTGDLRALRNMGSA